MRQGGRPAPAAGSRGRVVAALAATACLVGVIVSVWSLAGRIHAYNTRPDRKVYTFMPVEVRSFAFAGRPVAIQDHQTESQTVVEITYGERSLRIPASIKPGPAELPGLARHADWLRVFRFAEWRGSPEEFKARIDQGQDRLVVVIRRPRIAPDPRTGEVPRTEWLFDFHEFLPDGTIATHTLRYPKTRGDREPAPDELKRNTWEMDAAMSLMPGASPDTLSFGRPSASFKDDALRVAGWTFPTAVVSVLGLMASLVYLMAPRRAPDA